MNRRIYIAILAICTITILSGCQKDESVASAVPVEGKARIVLSLPDMATRSVASTNERSFHDLAVLIFRFDTVDNISKYVNGALYFKDDFGLNNGFQTFTITTDLDIIAGDSVLLLGNTGFKDLPTGLSSKITTIDDINDLYPADSWNINQGGEQLQGNDSGYGMPMTGLGYCNSPSTTIPVTLTRSVAKIQLELKITGQDVTGEFLRVDLDGKNMVRWGIYNVLSQDKGLLYVPEGTTTCQTADSIKITDFTFEKYDHVSTGFDFKNSRALTYYMPEYPSATMAKGHPVEADVFDPDRTCMIVKAEDAGFYRLDLHKDGKYIDIRRNSHYVITINEVNTWGFRTVEAALANPGSNVYTRSGGKPAIGYDIQVIDGK